MKRAGWLKLLISGAALAFLLRYLARYWQQIPPFDPARLAPVLLACLAVYTALRVGSALLWGMALRRFAPDFGLAGAVQVHTRAMLARYIPGNVWHIVNITLWCRQEGVPAGSVVAASLLENAYSVLGGALVALLTAPWWLLHGTRSQALTLAAALLIGLVLVHPRVLSALLALPLRLLKKPPLAMPLSFGQSLGFVALYAAVFLAQGLALYPLALAVEPGHPLSPPGLAGIYAAAWTIGFLSLITPSGLGVREGLMTWMLARSLPAGSALLLPLLMRLLMTLAEVAAAALPFRAGRKRPPVAGRQEVERS